MGSASPATLFNQFKPAQRAYLVALSQHGRVHKACADAKVVKAQPWHWRRNTEGFEEAERLAKDIGAESLVEAAYARAVEGIDIPIVREGIVVATYKQYSDKLLEVLLKGHRPDTYKERRELSGDPDRPLQVQLVDFREVSDGD